MSNKPLLVSILIPCRSLDQLTADCIRNCRNLTYDRIEIIILADEAAAYDGVKVVQTGTVTPGRKRNIGASVASGEILAYIDSDAYPRPDWITNAVTHLQGHGVGAVGGPGLTPDGDGRLAKAQGAILSSFLMGGIATRYTESKVVEVDDIHSVNFVAWRRVIDQVGGWDEYYWPGEDTLMSLKIKKAGCRQLLASDVIVYHHRRSSWRGYAKQIWNYGLHRGFFAKRFPETSRRLGYALPSVMLVGLIVIPLLSVLFSWLWWIYLSAIMSYFLLALIVTGRCQPSEAPLTFIGIPMTHIIYGVGFLRGLASRRLSR